jgi:hypothetical protein
MRVFSNIQSMEFFISQRNRLIGRRNESIRRDDFRFFQREHTIIAEARATFRTIATFPDFTDNNRSATSTTPRGEEPHTHYREVFPHREVGENRAFTNIVSQIGDSTDSVTDSLDTDTVRCFSVFFPERLEQFKGNELTIIDKMEMKIIAIRITLDLESADIGIDFVFSAEMLEEQVQAGA